MKVPVGRYGALLITYLRAQRRRFAMLTIFMLSVIGLQIAIPQITRYFIDTAISERPTEQLRLAALAFIGLAFLQQAIAVATMYFSENVAWTATNALRADLARHVLRLDMRFHNERPVGELIERIDNDVTQLADFFTRIVLMIGGNLLSIVGILIMLFLEDWRLGAALGAFTVTALVSLAAVRNIAIPTEKLLRQANAELYGYLEERLSATEDIRASGAVAAMITGLLALQNVILERWQATVVRQWLIQVIAGAMVTLSYVVAIVAGYALFQSGAISLGATYLTLSYAILLTRPLHELATQVDRLQSIGASIERVEELFSMESGIQDGSVATLPSGALALTCENASFAYGDAETVLSGICFELAPGEVLGLLGRTGSGKTTLARLILRLYDVDDGRIKLGGHDTRDLSLSELRRRVAVVTQDVQIFEASVRDNLTFFDRAISDAQINAALETLGLADWVAGLPEGIDTPIEAQGRNLSAGEAQLLAMARVFLRDPGLVILDEASARLDPATEARLEHAVTKLLENRAAIIIAHRLQTAQRADSILVLQDGRQLEYGKREQLVADTTSHFHHLLQTGLEEALA